VEAAVARDLEGKLLRTTPTGRRVVTLSESAGCALARGDPQLLVEEDKPLIPFRMPGLPPMVAQATGSVLAVRVRAPGGGRISDCSVYALVGDVGYRGVTNAEGARQTRDRRVGDREHCCLAAAFLLVEAVSRRFIGRGISVAVIDPGLASGTRSVRAVAGINTLDGAEPWRWDVDEKATGLIALGS
jgi:hypothetical protein